MKQIIFKIASLFYILLIVGCGNHEDNSPPEETIVSLEGQGQSLLSFSALADVSCGEITVVVDQLETRTMDGEALSSSFVHCQDTSPSIVQWVDIPAGTYSYSASCSSYTWTGTRVLSNANCNNLTLTASSAD